MVRILVLALFVVHSSLRGFAQDAKPKLTYVFDPLCSWCYTFGPVIEKIHAKYQHQLHFEVVSGGMVLGQQVKPISYIAEYILDNYQQKESLSGVKFGKPYLGMVAEGKELLDSEKPSYAVEAFRKFKPEQAVAFAHSLQKAMYVEGKSFQNDSTYRFLAEEYHIDPTAFLATLYSDSVKVKTYADFRRVEEAGISGFPTLILSRNGMVTKVSQGYESFEKIDRKLNKLLR